MRVMHARCVRTSFGSAYSATVAMKYSDSPVEHWHSTVTHMAGTMPAYWYARGTAMTPPPMKHEVRFSAVPNDGLCTCGKEWAIGRAGWSSRFV